MLSSDGSVPNVDSAALGWDLSRTDFDRGGSRADRAIVRGLADTGLFVDLISVESASN